MKKRTYFKFGLDILMAITFVLFFNTRVLGGLTFHEIAGLVIAAVFFTHILLNWKWVKNVTVRLFDRKLPAKTKLGYVLNLLLLISMAFIIISGIFVSKVVFPNIQIGNEQWFKMAHMAISYLALILVAVHVGLHWKWVINVFKNIFKWKTAKPIYSMFAKVLTVALLVFGVYQMYSSNFITHVTQIANVFNPSSSQMQGGGFGHGERPDFSGDGFEGHFDGQAPVEGDFERGEIPFDKSGHSEAGLKGEGKTGGASLLNVIVQYFSIISVIVIVTYYVEKIILRIKRRKKQSKEEIIE